MVFNNSNTHFMKILVAIVLNDKCLFIITTFPEFAQLTDLKSTDWRIYRDILFLKAIFRTMLVAQIWMLA